MADPRTELADIIVPAAPESMAAAGSGLVGWAAVALIALVLGALLAGLWRRRRPARALRAIAIAAAQRQGTPAALAARLDAWARRRLRLARVDAARCPAGLEPAAWSEWAATLARVRFAAPQSDGFERVAHLCASARAWSRHV